MRLSLLYSLLVAPRVSDYLHMFSSACVRLLYRGYRQLQVLQLYNVVR
jgi:hypothetical protein